MIFIKKYNISKIFSNYCIERLLDENNILFNKVINNQDSSIYLLVKHLKKDTIIQDYNKNKIILNEIKNNENIINYIKQDLYVNDNILDKLENLNQYNEDTNEYKMLYDDIISVGEYSNI